MFLKTNRFLIIKTMPRISWSHARFPVVFGSFLVTLCAGFYFRHSFWPDMEEQRRILMWEDQESRKALEQVKTKK